MASESPRPAFLGPGSLVNVQTTIAAIAVAVGGYASYSSLRSEIKDGAQASALHILEIKGDIQSLRQEISAKTDDRWRKTDMKLWILQVQRANPTLSIPDPQ